MANKIHGIENGDGDVYESYAVIAKAVQNAAECVSDIGAFNMRGLMDDLHWILFELKKGVPEREIKRHGRPRISKFPG